MATLIVGGRTVLVDDEDLPLVSGRIWHIALDHQTRYVQSQLVVDGITTTQRMHVMLTGYPETDHINGCGLDNRRANLRAVTHSQNMMNQKPRREGTSQYKGVYWHTARRHWVATICRDGRDRHIGSFGDEVEAALAYDAAARQLFGVYARPNFDEVPLPGKEAVQST